MEKHNVENILHQVYLISKKYNEIAKITGENFNVFRVLKLETREVRTHSAFLAELLNPKGSHGLQDAFLRLFIQQFKIENFDTNNAEVKKEEVIENGRLDITIVNEKRSKCIIIENKIQDKNQGSLPTYVEHAKRKYGRENCNLFFLTLLGDKPEVSTEFEEISYKDGIKKWLELCHKEASSHPIIRESIIQYINLINYLTNQTMNDIQKKEIVKQIIKTPEAVEAAFLILESQDQIKQELFAKLKKQIFDIADELKLKCLPYNLKDEAIDDESEFYFCIDKWNSCCIGIGLENWKWYYGICKLKTADNIDEKIIQNLKHKLGLSEEQNPQPDTAWLWWKWFSNWNKSTPWKEIMVAIANDTMKNEIREKVEELFKILKEDKL